MLQECRTYSVLLPSEYDKLIEIKQIVGVVNDLDKLILCQHSNLGKTQNLWRYRNGLIDKLEKALQIKEDQ